MDGNLRKEKNTNKIQNHQPFVLLGVANMKHNSIIAFVKNHPGLISLRWKFQNLNKDFLT